MGVGSAFEVALLAVDRDDSDAATIELARTYCFEIDADADLLAALGPKLLACLTELLMTPKARAAVAKGGDDAPHTSPVDELRARRRQRGATDLDPPASGTDT